MNKLSPQSTVTCPAPPRQRTNCRHHPRIVVLAMAKKPPSHCLILASTLHVDALQGLLGSTGKSSTLVLLQSANCSVGNVLCSSRQCDSVPSHHRASAPGEYMLEMVGKVLAEANCRHVVPENAAGRCSCAPEVFFGTQSTSYAL